MGGTPNIQDNSDEVERIRGENARQAITVAEAKAVRDREEFSKRLLDSFSGAQTMARGNLTDRGLDPAQWYDKVAPELEAARSRVPSLDPNPGAYFSPDLVTTALNRHQDLTRTRNTNQVNERFNPNFGKDKIRDDMDDGLIDKIVDEEFGRAKGSVDAAFKRGNLNDTGYNTALGELTTGRGTAKSTVDGFGNAVLDRYRSGLGSIKDRAVTGANSYTVGGSQFDISPYTQEADDYAQKAGGMLEGDLRSAVGGSPLFNVGDVLRKAGGAQGPINPANNPNNMIASVFANKKRTNDQGVGSGGVF